VTDTGITCLTLRTKIGFDNRKIKYGIYGGRFMKKVIITLVFIFLTSAVFAQLIDFETSEGMYSVPKQHPSYVGRFCGEQTYLKNVDIVVRYDNFIPNVTLSRGQLEVVQLLLSRFNTTAGDTFYIGIFTNRGIGPKIDIYCEFTSNTRFNYWAYKYGR
jgi:hypothetical protein